MPNPERNDALANFTPEELHIFWADIGRAGRYAALCVSVLEAAQDELASLASVNAGAYAEDTVICSTKLLGDAHGYALSAAEILTALQEAWK